MTDDGFVINATVVVVVVDSCALPSFRIYNWINFMAVSCVCERKEENKIKINSSSCCFWTVCCSLNRFLLTCCRFVPNKSKWDIHYVHYANDISKKKVSVKTNNGHLKLGVAKLLLYTQSEKKKNCNDACFYKWSRKSNFDSKFSQMYNQVWNVLYTILYIYIRPPLGSALFTWQNFKNWQIFSISIYQ